MATRETGILTYLKPINLFTAVAMLLLWCVNCLPYSLKLRVGKGFGILLSKLLKRRLHIAQVNLKLCFSDKSPDEIDALARKSIVNLGVGLIEAAIAWWDRPAKVHAMTEFRGRQYLDHALTSNKGVLLIGAHFSTLDMGGILLSKHYLMYAIFRMQNNQVLNHVMTRGRNRTLRGSIEHTSMRKAVKKLKEGEIVWYSPDQDMGQDHSVFVPFFDHIAATVTAPAKIARLSDAAVIMMATWRKPDDSGYVVEFIPGPEGFPGEDASQNAAQINRLVEQGIMKAPEQYAWYHRRFKTQPELEKGELYS